MFTCSIGSSSKANVYAICRTLSQESIITREQGKCELCRNHKLVNLLLTNQSDENVEDKSLIEANIKESRTVDWYWEGNVQAKVVSHPAKNRYEIRNVSDTASRAPGKDIVAITPDGNELWISVKGYPEKSANVQAAIGYPGQCLI